MALTKCAECNNEVSDKAEACPKCGAPIASAREADAAGTHIKTVQETSKKFKLQTLFSIFLIIIGFIIFSANDGSQGEPPTIAFWLIIIGFLWYIVNRIRIWWHHK